MIEWLIQVVGIVAGLSIAGAGISMLVAQSRYHRANKGS